MDSSDMTDMNSSSDSEMRTPIKRGVKIGTKRGKYRKKTKKEKGLLQQQRTLIPIGKQLLRQIMWLMALPMDG